MAFMFMMTVCKLYDGNCLHVVVFGDYVTFSRNGSEVGQALDTDLYKNPKVYNKVKSQSSLFSIYLLKFFIMLYYNIENVCFVFYLGENH